MINAYTPTELVVVDDFYKDPDAVRRKALEDEFTSCGEYYPGLRTLQPFLPQTVKKRLQAILASPVDWDATKHNGVFQVNRKCDESKQYIHVDSSHWAGLVYLSKEQGPGTRFYRHRASGLSVYPSKKVAEAVGRRRDMDPFDVANELIEDRADESKWTTLFEVPFRFNRLVMYPASQFHRNATCWGETPQDARLTQIFFFRLCAA